MKKLGVVMSFVLVSQLLTLAVGAQIRYKQNEKDAVIECRKIDIKGMENIKGKMTAVGAVSVVGGLGNVGSAFITGFGKNTKGSAWGITSAVATGIAAGGAGASVTMSGMSLKEINEILDSYSDCHAALSSI